METRGVNRPDSVYDPPELQEIKPEIQQMLLPIGHPNRPGIKLESLGALIFHYTANDHPGATDTANSRYIGRKYIKEGPNKFYEADGKTEFRYASAHIFCDNDSITEIIPPDEVAWGCGDRRLPYNNGHRGQQPISDWFDHRQNYRTISIEICNNDVFPGPDDWYESCQRAQDWAIWFLRSRKINVDLNASIDPQHILNPEEGKIMLLRHYDMTGKICPKPFVDDPGAWLQFIERIYGAI